MALTLGAILIAFIRQRSRNDDVFASPGRTDVQITRNSEDGTETKTIKQVRVVKHTPEDQHYLGQLRQRLRESRPQLFDSDTENPPSERQSSTSSADTLVDRKGSNSLPSKLSLTDDHSGSNPPLPLSSKVSLTNHANDEKHENLIELKTQGPNKTFFDPETGEYIHLGWKSSGDSDNDVRPSSKGSIKRALAAMGTGGAALAGGKESVDILAKGLEPKDESSAALGQRVGDCVAGLVTNEPRAGKPTTA